MGTDQPESEYSLTKQEAGKILGLNPRVITNKAQHGELPGRKIGPRQSWRFRQQDLEDYLTQQKQGAQQQAPA